MKVFITSIIAFLVTTNSAYAMCMEGSGGGSCTKNGHHGHFECIGGHPVCLPDGGDDPDEPDDPPVSGTVRPKFYVLTVVYAPPGTATCSGASNVSYGSGSSFGTTTTASSAFKQGYEVSVKASGGFLGNGASVGLSLGYGREAGSTDELSIKKSTNSTLASRGPCSDGIDHDYDQIWLWLNPKLNVTFDSNAVSWTLDSSTQTDIQYLYVAWLKNPSQIPPGVLQRLQAYGIDQNDYGKILQADPLASGSTAALQSDRFQPIHSTFPYEPPLSEGDPVPTLSFQTTYSEAATATNSVKNQYTVGVSVETSGSFFSLFEASAKASGEWTWTSVDTTSNTSGTNESATVTISGPSFGYTGPTDIAVYYDVVYKTFAFAPVSGTLRALSGLLLDASGVPLPHQPVELTSDGVTYHTLTDQNGEYRVFGDVEGEVELSAPGIRRIERLPQDRVLDLSRP